ncbi:LA_2272 family surface repeat-containing protein [Pontiella sp.]|uniref:LA_2272 family surface repeat-containing protein n=1 Tax=Pontiella sp. TaxID=2837462 RepID=UPI0035690893
MKKLIMIAAGCAFAAGVYAETAAFQASLVPDIALQSRDTDIKGASIGVWNENPSSKFQWQLGFVNGSTGDSVGVQWFVFLPTFFNYAENYTGAQLGVVNYASGDFTGLQWGLANYSASLTGVQLGVVNVAKAVDSGFQWGLVNYAETTHNLFQLGLVNIMTDNNWFTDVPGDLAKGFVIVNWTFGDK